MFSSSWARFTLVVLFDRELLCIWGELRQSNLRHLLPRWRVSRKHPYTSEIDHLLNLLRWGSNFDVNDCRFLFPFSAHHLSKLRVRPDLSRLIEPHRASLWIGDPVVFARSLRRMARNYKAQQRPRFVYLWAMEWWVRGHGCRHQLTSLCSCVRR